MVSNGFSQPTGALDTSTPVQGLSIVAYTWYEGTTTGNGWSSNYYAPRLANEEKSEEELIAENLEHQREIERERRRYDRNQTMKARHVVAPRKLGISSQCPGARRG